MGTGPAEHLITHGALTAVVTEVGGGIRLLEHDGRPLLRGYAAGEVRPRFRGALLAPWPNRIGDGRYRFGGAEHQLPLSEPERRTALHGLVGEAHFDVRRIDGAAVVATHPLAPRPGYPFGPVVSATYALVPRPGYPFGPVVSATYALDDDGLTTTVTVRNDGGQPLPWGTAGHPYLVAGDGAGPVDGWELTAPATEVLEVDVDRLLPADPPVTRPVVGDQDFTSPRLIGGTALDHAFTGIRPEADGRARVRLVDPATGVGSQLAWDPAVLPWLQLHTADVPAPEGFRTALAVEAMTCPPDAFRSGVDLVVVEPGGEHTAAWTIGPLG